MAEVELVDELLDELNLTAPRELEVRADLAPATHRRGAAAAGRKEAILRTLEVKKAR